MGTYGYLVLLAEGGIVQWEHFYESEEAAWQHHDRWELSEEDHDAYVYRIAAPGGVTVQRGQGDKYEPRYFPVD